MSARVCRLVPGVASVCAHVTDADCAGGAAATQGSVLSLQAPRELCVASTWYPAPECHADCIGAVNVKNHTLTGGARGLVPHGAKQGGELSSVLAESHIGTRDSKRLTTLDT